MTVVNLDDFRGRQVILLHAEANVHVVESLIEKIVVAKNFVVANLITNNPDSDALFLQANHANMMKIAKALARRLSCSRLRYDISEFKEFRIVKKLSHQESGNRTHSRGTYLIRELSNSLGLKKYDEKVIIDPVHWKEDDASKCSITPAFIESSDEDLRPQQFPGYRILTDINLY